jgi:hypothetical protein
MSRPEWRREFNDATPSRHPPRFAAGDDSHSDGTQAMPAIASRCRLRPSRHPPRFAAGATSALPLKQWGRAFFTGSIEFKMCMRGELCHFQQNFRSDECAINLEAVLNREYSIAAYGRHH